MKPYLLILENFQSIRERTEIPISPLTFLYGPNSAGKSCVDDAFTLLSSVFSGTEGDHWAMLKRWVHYEPAAIQPIKLQGSRTHLALHCQIGQIFNSTSEVGAFGVMTEHVSGLIGWFQKCEWNIVLGLEGDQGGIHALTLSAGNETVFRIDMSDDDDRILQISTKAFGRTFQSLADKHFVDIKKRQRVYEFECEMVMTPTPFLSIYKGEDLDRDIVAIVNAILEDLKGLEISPINLGADRSTIKNSALSKICGGAYVYGNDWHAGRGLPSSFYHAPEFDMGIASGYRVDFMSRLANSSYESAYSEIHPPPPSINSPALHAAFDTLVTSRMDLRPNGAEKLHVFVNRCLREHLFLDQGYQLTFEALEIKPATGIEEPSLTAALMIGSLIDKTGRRMTFEDVGTGISCVIPVLVAVHSGNGFIQQPELHLHPALQSALGDVFIEATKVQQAYHFIETHSEYILLRCLRRVRETTAGKHPAGSPFALAPEDLSVLYFEPQLDGCTKVKTIRVSTQGDFIDRWPRGFFEERGKELFDE